MGGPGGNLNAAPREILPGVRVYPDAREVARAGARFFVEYAWQSIARHGRFFVALSGGNTPRLLFKFLASSDFRGQVDWAKVQIFWSDERAVGPDDPESNYGMARRELLIHVPVPEGNVHRMEAEKTPIGRAAHDYEEVLRKYLNLDEHGFPQFDLIFLGMGADGHTASLFPGSRITNRTSRWVITPMVAKLGAHRMSFTLPVLNAARRVAFLVVGLAKAKTLRAVLEGKTEPPFPAQLVHPLNGSPDFLIDEEAAGEIEKGRALDIGKTGAPKPTAPRRKPERSK